MGNFIHWIGANHGITAVLPMVLIYVYLAATGYMREIRWPVAGLCFCAGVAGYALFVEQNIEATRQIVQVHGLAILIGGYVFVPYIGWKLWTLRHGNESES